MLYILYTALALAFASSTHGEYVEWTSAAVTARPHVKAVLPLNRLSLKSWPIDSITLNVDMAGSQSEIGLNPVLVADLIHSSWCSRIANGSLIRYLPLSHFVPSPAATWNLKDGKTTVKTKHVTNWVSDICVVIRPLGHDISSKVSASAWTKRMNVEMGIGLDSALTNMLITMLATTTALIAVAFTAVIGFRKSDPARQIPAATNTVDSQGDNVDENPEDSEESEEEEEEEESDEDDDDYDDEYDKESDNEYEIGYDGTRSSSPESVNHLCDDGFVDVKSHAESGKAQLHQRRH